MVIEISLETMLMKRLMREEEEINTDKRGRHKEEGKKKTWG